MITTPSASESISTTAHAKISSRWLLNPATFKQPRMSFLSTSTGLCQTTHHALHSLAAPSTLAQAHKFTDGGKVSNCQQVWPAFSRVFTDFRRFPCQTGEKHRSTSNKLPSRDFGTFETPSTRGKLSTKSWKHVQSIKAHWRL